MPTTVRARTAAVATPEILRMCWSFSIDGRLRGDGAMPTSTTPTDSGYPRVPAMQEREARRSCGRSVQIEEVLQPDGQAGVVGDPPQACEHARREGGAVE